LVSCGQYGSTSRISARKIEIHNVTPAPIAIRYESANAVYLSICFYEMKRYYSHASCSNPDSHGKTCIDEEHHIRNVDSDHTPQLPDAGDHR
jgi:hypothetical protein